MTSNMKTLKWALIFSVILFLLVVGYSVLFPFLWDVTKHAGSYVAGIVIGSVLFCIVMFSALIMD